MLRECWKRVMLPIDYNNMKLFYVCNIDTFFISHRLPLAIRAIEQGYDVTLISAKKDKSNILSSYGIRHIEFPFERAGTNPFHEFRCILKLYKIYRKYKPDIIHHITLKACLLGSLAAKASKNKHVVNAISGFGYSFTGSNAKFVRTIILHLIKIAFKSNTFTFILQNPDDFNYIKSLRIVPENNVFLIKGSGINLETYGYSLPLEKDHLAILFPARILIDKGVLEFLEAAKTLKKHHLKKRIKFILAGDCDQDNPSVLKEEILKQYLESGYIDWIGFQDNMYDVYKNADIVVLPSYREGLPKSLIEACAVGRPIITTDVPGCRECVIDGYNGFLIPVKNSNAIATKLFILIDNESLRLQMGKCGREFAEREFSIENVVNKHFEIYNTINQY